MKRMRRAAVEEMMEKRPDATLGEYEREHLMNGHGTTLNSMAAKGQTHFNLLDRKTGQQRRLDG